MTAPEYHVGDVTEVMATLEPGSVDLVMTSPPFLALRSYLPADHPDKHREIGSEATPADFLDTLLGLTAAWGDLLAPHGSICVELGDTYSGSGGGGGDYLPGGLRENQPGFGGSAERARDGNAAHWRQKAARKDEWPLPKSMCLVPQAYALSLAYGLNVLTGQPSPAGRWRVRNVVSWVRPNPPVGALGDKYRPATSWLTIACRASDRWFDLDDVRKPNPRAGEQHRRTERHRAPERGGERETNERAIQNPNGAPPLDWWKISTSPYKGSHYAAFPEALCEIPIRSMCPRSVCTTCGEPRRRITSDPEYIDANGLVVDGKTWASGIAGGRGAHSGKTDGNVTRTTRTTGWTGWTGWTDCGHGTWRPGVVLDPFAGSGTTLAVAMYLGRKAIGIDLDERNVALAMERVGPLFLQTIHHERQENASVR